MYIISFQNTVHLFECIQFLVEKEEKGNNT